MSTQILPEAAWLRPEGLSDIWLNQRKDDVLEPDGAGGMTIAFPGTTNISTCGGYVQFYRHVCFEINAKGTLHLLFFYCDILLPVKIILVYNRQGYH